jgi:hypothetical protein
VRCSAGVEAKRRQKFLLKLFSKSLRFPKAAPWSLAHERNPQTALFFLQITPQFI